MKTRHTQDERDILSMKGTCLLRLMRTDPLAPHATLRNTSCTAPTKCSMHCVPLVPTPQHLVDADDVADVLVLELGGVDGLGDVPGHGRVVEVLVDVVVHAVGHALEEVGHVRVPGRLPGPGRVVERVHPQDLDEHGALLSIPM